MNRCNKIVVSAIVVLFSVTPGISSAVALTNLNGLKTQTQTFATNPNAHLLISSSGSAHTFNWNSTPWLLNQGGTGATSFIDGSIPFIWNGSFSQNNSQLSWDNANTILSLGGATTSLAKMSIKGSGSLGLFSLISSTGTSLLYINSVGNVGIATADPSEKLDIMGNVKLSGTLFSSVLTVTGASTLLGNVGIGNSNPQHALDVSGAMYSRLITTSSSAINWNLGNVQSLTLTSSPILTFDNAQAGGEYTLIINQDTVGGRMITWPVNVKWSGGIIPILTSARSAADVIRFVFNGVDYLGNPTFNFKHTPIPPPPPSGNIAFDNKTSANPLLNACSVTWSHAVNGSNPILFVMAEGQGNSGATSVTYDGVPLTQVGSNITGGNSDVSNIWYLINPPTGPHGIIINRVCAGNTWFSGVAASYTGVNQSNPIDAVGVATGSSNVASKTIAANTDGDWGLFMVLATASKTALTNSSELFNDFIDHTSVYDNSSVAPITPAGNYTMEVGLSPATSWSALMVAFSPVN
jgi:hypothetical protein